MLANMSISEKGVFPEKNLASVKTEWKDFKSL